MPVVQGRTREQIRVSVGYNLQALYVSSTTSSVDATSVVDTTLRGGDDAHNGKWMVQTSGANDEEIRQISDYTQSSTDMTVAPAFSNTVASGVTYELWNEAYNPARINDFIDQAVIEVTGRVYDPETDVSLHTDGASTTYSIPSQFAMLNKVEQRKTVDSTRIHECGATFDERTDGDFTQSLDTKDKRQGNQSLKLTIASGASAGDFITDSITSKDISKYDYIEMWVKSTVATSSGNLKLLLDDSASCASPLETLSLPALTADTWTYCRMALSSPELDTAIISVGFEYDSDLGACVVWIDDIKAVVDASATWEKLGHHLWSIDKSNRNLVFTLDGRAADRKSVV